ncbi:ABC transporter permease [Phytohabitans aurantiacus]|uniref:ABC transporter permease n=1 Tax=Phytohabitans aurantiacus TaxID=3016789 RepID=A0ABQ5R7W7_9ACTN|nr:ABC-2 family transporter protein [Phytohabitans aurantiacus]GLI02257.1 ABC transporter permease [Phytohabitans aurantiacus]
MLTLRFIKLSIKAALEYRTDFIFMIAVGIIWQVTVVAFATVVITRFPGLGGWSAGDVLLVASVRLAGHTFASGFFIGLRQVSELTADGKIDAFLLRPLPVYRQVMLNYFHMPEFGGLAVVAVMFAAAVRMVDIDWTPWRIGYLVASVVGATLLEVALQTVLGAFALRRPTVKLWQEWTEELMAAFGNYPLHILPNLAWAVFVFVLPIAFCAYFPVAVLTGQTSSLPVPAGVAVASPLISATLFLAALGWWRIELRRYESVGG